MTLFAKITQLFSSLQDSSIENSPASRNLLNREQQYGDPTASAETVELVLGNLGQQFAARNVSPIKADGKPDGKGGYIVSVHPTELGIKRWSKEVTPQMVSQKAVEKLLDDFGIKDEKLRKEAIAKLGNNELIFELGKERAIKRIKTGDFGKRDLMLVGTNKLGGVDVRFDAEQVNWLKNLAKIEKLNELASKIESNQPLQTETTILGSTAVLNLPKAIELPKIDAKPLLVLGAEAAIPAAVIGTQVGAIAWTADQIATNAHRKWEQETRINSLPLPSTVLTNKAEEPTKPETTVADKTKPQVQSIPDEKDLPKGELAVRPKAQPQPPTKADNPNSPTIENVPSPYKNQPNSPNKLDLNRVIPNIITTGALTKFAYDKIRDREYQLDSEDVKQLQAVADHRVKNEMPVVSGESDTGTVASTEINGQKIYGHSTIIERNSKIGHDNREARKELLKELQDAGILLNKPYGHRAVNVVTHAEIEVLIEARKKLGSLEGKDLKIYVDREPCNECYQAIPRIAAKWKMGTITIISNNPETGAGKVIIFKPQGEGVK